MKVSTFCKVLRDQREWHMFTFLFCTSVFLCF
uniref:Uncharacterized protein n=1 Tax=Arundo donax TaxID=35708 RepID=A0A0A8YA78_ARUDO